MLKGWLSFITVVLVANWYLKTTSLPKLYYRLQDRRDVRVNQLRKLERIGVKVTKLSLDLKYFD